MRDCTHFFYSKEKYYTLNVFSDFEKIQTKCKKRTLNGNHLQVEQVSICNCIEVSGLGSNTTHDTILYYFENPRCGGGDVIKVDYTDGCSVALVFFEDSSGRDPALKLIHSNIYGVIYHF